MSRIEPIYLGGPTASGKTAVGIELAGLLEGGGEVVNADAFQLYDELRVVTARPSSEEEEACPHHLFGVVPLTERCDAQKYRELALPMIDEIIARGSWPIVVGGSGLYLKALTHGLAPVPPADPALREELAALSLEEKFARLEEVDPVGASTIDRQNDRYLSRALEISLLAGRPGSEIKAEWLAHEPEVKAFWLDWDREVLKERIALRSQTMLEEGAIEEIEGLEEVSETAGRAIGVGEIRRHLAGETTLEECAEELTIATRQYAKRQRTWFRREDCFQAIEVSKGDSALSLAEQIAAQVHAECHE